MRLLHAATEQLYEFNEYEIPPYGILSHVWEKDEVSYHDVVAAGPDEAYKSKRGWAKIRGCCQQALRDRLEFVWVDTCCIDKSSSAELQEAINSMFKWYETSQICYAYLVDVPPGEQPTAAGSSFRRSRWFARGWTLQELIAPTVVKFMDQTWTEIGTRYALRHTITSITSIGEDVLVGAAYGARRAMRNVSVAQRMSWAANRVTTRLEDMAYCLLGIFEINIPLLYGEGTKAFQRLQEEIIKISNDQTILAWGYQQAMPGLWGTSFALAQSPSDFAECSNLQFYGVGEPGDDFSMTQRGLQLNLPIIEMDDGAIVYCILSCGPSDPTSTERQCLAVPMLRNSRGRGIASDEYSRMSLKMPTLVVPSEIPTPSKRRLYLPRYWTHRGEAHWRYHRRMRIGPRSAPGDCIAAVYPPAITSHDQIVLDSDLQYIQSMIHIRRAWRPDVLIILRRDIRARIQYTGIYPPLGRLSDCDLHSHPDRVKLLLQRAIQHLLGIPMKHLQDDRVHLSDLGMDSLSSLHLVKYLRQETGLPLDLETFTGTVSLRDVAKRLEPLILSQRYAPQVRGGKTNRGSDLKAPVVLLDHGVDFRATEVPENFSLLSQATYGANWDHLKPYSAKFSFEGEKPWWILVRVPLNEREVVKIWISPQATNYLDKNYQAQQQHSIFQIDIVPNIIA